MAWLRIDDGFAEHPKVQACSERARWLHVTALCYSARNLNDGLLDAKAVKVVCAIVDRPCKQAIAELIKTGLWIERGEGCFQIKDYLDWNPDSGTVKRLRAQRQASGAIGGRTKRQANAQANALASASDESEANAQAFVRTPSPPIPSHEIQNPFGATEQEWVKSLCLATGARAQADVDKIVRTLHANQCSAGSVRLAIEAATHPSAKDPLACALSTLKKRRAA